MNAKKGTEMVTAIIAMNVERGKVNEVAEKLADMEGISEVYSVSGSMTWWPLPGWRATKSSRPW